MKKFLVIVLVIVCLGGLGFLGYTVFRSKNIVSVEIEGQMQTLYLVNESTSPDFEDAKLKVTYKNGNVKYVEMSKAKVSDFSTSVVTNGEMKLTYKSQTVKVPYNVIRSGMYYVKGMIYTTSDSEDSVPISEPKDAEIMFYLNDDGSLLYYKKNLSLGGRWELYDGRYDSTYNYTVGGDTLKLNFGEDETYDVKATYKDDVMTISSKTIQTGSTGVTSTEITRIYANISSAYKTDAKIDNIKLSVIGEENSGTTEDDSIAFKQGTNIETSKKDIFLEVDFNQFLISYTNESANTENMLDKVYVKLTDAMLAKNSLRTDGLKEVADAAQIHYGNYEKTVTLWYTVVKA